MPSDLHPLLQRQLRRAGLDVQAPGLSGLPELLERVSRSYTDADQSRYLVERSQQIVSEEMSQLYAELQASQARLGSLLSLSSDWVWEQDAQFRFTYLSAELNHLGVDVAALLGQQAKLRDLPPVLGHDPATVEALMAARQPFRNFIYGVRRRDGTPLYVRASGEPCFEQGQFAGYRGVATDVSETVVNALALERLARFDSLTGLPNRTQFVQQLEAAIHAASEARQQLAVLFVDLDRFKIVNDSLGHFSGDELLRVMASRLEGQLRCGDLVGRHGGDEFVVMARGPLSPDGLAEMATRLLATLQEPLRLEGHQVQVSGSIGIALFPDHGRDASDLIKHADEAMYRAKARGQNRFEVFSQGLAQRTAEFFVLETELRQAIPAGELRLHYQPKFNAGSGELCGMEALVRWQHPQRGLLGPGQFIELAEETGLIVPMGRWLLRDAGRQLRRWQRLGLQVPRCALNLSPRQFLSDSIFEDVASMLHDSGLSPQALELEITEGVLISDVVSVQSELGRLHALGVHLTVDDFGTGYSSLAYLKRFPVGTLKLDRSFVAGLPQDKDDVAITRAVLAMAHSLGLGVVAEGVETPSQMQTLRELGCDELQGFLLGRPMPAEQMQGLLRSADVVTDERRARSALQPQA